MTEAKTHQNQKTTLWQSASEAQNKKRTTALLLREFCTTVHSHNSCAVQNFLSSAQNTFCQEVLQLRLLPTRGRCCARTESRRSLVEAAPAADREEKRLCSPQRPTCGASSGSMVYGEGGTHGAAGELQTGVQRG